MNYHYNIDFPALTFTSPGVYAYTMKEITHSDGEWKTDNRVYRVVITVIDNGDGILVAHLDYPDGWPNFVNMYKCKCCKCCPPPPPPCDICKCFNKLPFPMFLFAPPQKPEFTNIMQSTDNAFGLWENSIKYLSNYCSRYWWDCLQKRWRDDSCGYKGECFCDKH